MSSELTEPGPGPAGAAPTLSEVAKRAGVSSITVSRVVRMPDLVAPETRARVERAMRDLGYVPNLVAGALASARTNSVGVLVPIYLIFRTVGLLDTRTGLVFILCLGNLPIVIWMLFTYFKEIPKDILEAARMDGATIGRELIYVLTPMAVPGLASTLLLNLILAWNEAFWTLNLSTLEAAPLTVFIASYSSPEGLFWAKLSAASTLAIAPILVLGWFSQRQLVRGLTFGAVK